MAVAVLSLEIFAPLQSDKHPKILAWSNRVKQTIPIFDEMNTKFVEGYRQILHTTLGQQTKTIITDIEHHDKLLLRIDYDSIQLKQFCIVASSLNDSEFSIFFTININHPYPQDKKILHIFQAMAN